jgi:branched-chain amino acid aminotransferase
MVKAETFTIGSTDSVAGELTMSLREELTDIQYGRRPDVHGWMYRLDA